MLTDYLVLKKLPTGDGSGRPDASWAEVATVQAHGATDAIRKTTKNPKESDLDGGLGTFVAVPARSWKPRTLSVKTETRVVLS